MPRDSVGQLARTHPERLRLRYGPYRTPRFRYGKVVWCAARGDVTLCGLSEAPIPWPVGKKGRSRALVLFGALAEAVRRETALAVAYHWGVSPQTVTGWRKALGVGAVTDSTRAAKQEHFAEPWADEAREKAHAKAQDPARREKIAAGRRGRSRPAHVVDAMREGRGALPWTAEDDELVRTLPPAEAARRTGHPLRSVYRRRRALGLPDGRRR